MKSSHMKQMNSFRVLRRLKRTVTKSVVLRVASQLEPLLVFPAKTQERLSECYRLVYREYLQGRLCEPDETEEFCHTWAKLPYSQTLGLRDFGRLLGTVTIVSDSDCGLPLESEYHKELADIKKNDRKFAEISMLALDSRLFNRNENSLSSAKKMNMLFSLFGALANHCIREGITDLLICVRTKHAPLYRTLKFSPFAEERNYKTIINPTPSVPLHAKIEDIVKWAHENNLSHYITDSYGGRKSRTETAYDSSILSMAYSTI